MNKPLKQNGSQKEYFDVPKFVSIEARAKMPIPIFRTKEIKLSAQHRKCQHINVWNFNIRHKSERNATYL